MSSTTEPAPAVIEKPPAAPTPAGPNASDATQQPRFSGMGVLTIVLTLLGWTTIPLFLRYFKDDIDAWTANGWRYAISALIWGPVLIHSWSKGTMPKGVWRRALVPSLWNAAAQACFGLAPYYIKPGLMTFSLRLQIVFVAVGAAIMFPAERRVLRSPLFIGALLLTVAGTALTLLYSPRGLGEGNATGITLAVASGVGYAAYALGVRKHMMGINPIKAFAVVSQYTAAVLVVGMLIFGEKAGAGAFDHLSGHKWLLLVLSSVIGIGLGHTFYFFSIARLGLVISAGVVQLQPITVSIASIMIFDEELTRRQWLTGLIAVAGAVCMLIVQHRIARRPLRPA
jgi:drug/metabolite transporter (DMT)-like permease